MSLRVRGTRRFDPHISGSVRSNLDKTYINTINPRSQAARGMDFRRDVPRSS